MHIVIYYIHTYIVLLFSPYFPLSEKRFRRLFKAADTHARGSLSIADIENILFPITPYNTTDNNSDGSDNSDVYDSNNIHDLKLVNKMRNNL